MSIYCTVHSLYILLRFFWTFGQNQIVVDSFEQKWRIFQLDSAGYVSSLEGIKYMYLSLMASYVPICLMVKTHWSSKKACKNNGSIGHSWY